MLRYVCFMLGHAIQHVSRYTMVCFLFNK